MNIIKPNDVAAYRDILLQLKRGNLDSNQLLKNGRKIVLKYHDAIKKLHPYDEFYKFNMFIEYAFRFAELQC